MRSNRVIRNSLIYTCSNILLKAFNFFLLPLYTTYLTTSDYGVTNIASYFQSVASFVLAFSLYSAVIRFYSEYKDDVVKVRRYFSTVICFVMISGSVFFILAIIFKDLLIRVVFDNISFFPTVLIILISVIFYSLYTIYQDILKGMQQPKKSAIITLLYFIVQFGFNIFFVVYKKNGANGVLIANLLTGILFTILMFVDLIHNHLFAICIDWSMLKSSLKYSIPLLPHDLATQVTQLVSRIFINVNSSLATVGIFGVATQFGNVSDLISGSFHMAFQPWFFEKMRNRNISFNDEVNNLVDLLIWFFGFLFICLSLFSQEAVILMTKSSYHTAWKLVPFIVTSFSIKIPYYFYITILFYHKETTRKIFYATLSSSCVNLFLSYFFIQYWGAYGSVLADIIAMALRVSIIVLLTKNYNDVGYRIVPMIRKVVLIILFNFGGNLLSYTRYPENISIVNILYKILVIGVFVAIVVTVNRDKLKPSICDLTKTFFRKEAK